MPDPKPSQSRTGRGSRRNRTKAARSQRVPGQRELPPFTPTPVDRDAETAWVVQQANQLAPGAVDEALGHALDNTINARADQWVAQVHSEFAQYIGMVKYHRDRANSVVIYNTQLQTPDTHRAVETETARNAAAQRLRGENEKGAWAEPGHADPTMLAGRSRDRYIYALALLIAAAADITAFYQIVEQVQGNLTNLQVAVLVVGFSAMALVTAHFAGIMVRDLKAGAKWAQLFLVIFCAIAWVALGCIAFWVRLSGHPGAGSGGFTPSVTASGASSSSSTTNFQSTVPGAAMFAALYVATGVVAVVGGYLSHNPLYAPFARAVREHRAAARRNADAGKRLGDAEAERGLFDSQVAAAERVRDEAILARHGLAAELKQRARVEIATRLHDASATDAFMVDDARPYIYRPFPS